MRKSGGVFQLTWDKFKRAVSNHKKLAIIAGILAFVVSELVVGFFSCTLTGDTISLFHVIIYGIYPPYILFTLILTIFAMYGEYILFNVFNKGQYLDEEKNVVISEGGSCGTAHKMTGDDIAAAFNIGDYYENIGNIIGSDIKDKYRLFSIKPGYGINGNVCIYGSPGSGKSRCLVIPWIFNTIRRGESLIVADPKGELYRKTAECAKAHGYTVKIFNTNPKQMLHSDSIDFMSIIGDDEFQIDAFVDTIMSNISGTTDPDFWNKSQLNEMIFLTTYVAVNDVGIPKTLGGIYNLMNSNSVEELEDMFFSLPDDHPAKPAFNTWAQGDKTVKGNTHAGLQIDLRKMANKAVQKITGEPDIDLRLPGKEKCIYYVSMSDQERSMQWLVALFFTMLFQELVDEADKQKSGSLKVKVTILLDEFYNLGLIPQFDSRISQVRSRGIDCVLFLQSLGQLQKMYPENVWESILDCCSTTMLLQTRSYLTAEYFSKFSGEQTVITKGIRYQNAKGTEDIGVWVTVSESEKQRMLYTPHEVITKNKDRILVSTSTFNMVEVRKADYSEHPMCKEIREVLASEHIPDWVRRLSKKEKEVFRIDRETYREEGGWDIELCTEEDFREPWNKEKEKKLAKKVEQEMKKLGRWDDENEEEGYDRLATMEDDELPEEEEPVAAVDSDLFDMESEHPHTRVVYREEVKSSSGETIYRAQASSEEELAVKRKELEKQMAAGSEKAEQKKPVKPLKMKKIDLSEENKDREKEIQSVSKEMDDLFG